MLGEGVTCPCPSPNLPHLTALTGMHTVVEARGNVSAHFTQQHHAIELCRKRGASGEQEGCLSGQKWRFSGLEILGGKIRGSPNVQGALK